MDVSMITTLTGGSTGSVAAFASVPADTQQVLSAVAASTALSPAEKTSLVSAVAAADSGALSASSRAEVLGQIQGLGIYLNSTSNESWPRWTIMSALRTYGLNLSSEQSAPPAETEANARQAVAQVAQARGVTVSQAVAAVSALVASPVVAPVAPAAGGKPAAKPKGEPGHLVEKVV